MHVRVDVRVTAVADMPLACAAIASIERTKRAHHTNLKAVELSDDTHRHARGEYRGVESHLIRVFRLPALE